MSDFITASDIVFVLSGGSANSNPNQSLGGNPSSHQITGSINNLFDDISPEEALAGREEHRCFYIFNNSEDYTLYELELYIESSTEGGSSIDIGVRVADEVQKITIENVASGGTITFAYEEETAVVNYDADGDVWATNVETALLTFTAFHDISVEFGETVDDFIFFVTFQGVDTERAFSLITVDDNSLTGDPTVTITRTTTGSPINSIPSALGTETTPPAGVDFVDASEEEPLILNDLGPGEGVPIWVRRTTPAESDPLPDDGFTLRLKGKPFV